MGTLTGEVMAHGNMAWITVIHLDDQADYEDDVTGYFDTSYDDYSSCYAVADSVSTRDSWIVDSGCTDHLSP
jgi:hypothetical protein